MKPLLSLALPALLSAGLAQAEPRPASAGSSPPAEVEMDLDAAIARAQSHDPRVKEKQAQIGVARGLLAEAEGAKGWIVDLTTALALTTNVDGGFFEDGAGPQSNETVRDDLYDVDDGIGVWGALQFSLIKPLYTFGKVEHYKAAAAANVDVKALEVDVQRALTTQDVARAYFGLLAARDGRYLLEDAAKRLAGARDTAETLLEDADSGVKQSDLYALDAGAALIDKFLAQARAQEQIARTGLALLTDVPAEQIKLADRRLTPLPLPEGELAELQAKALEQRPEMQQLEAGLKARNELVEAKAAERMPNLFTGIVGSAAYAPERETLDNPFIYDPFNHYAASPVLGLQWHWETGRNSAQVAQAEAELDALRHLASFARGGIPFQVAEAWHQVQALHEAQGRLNEGSRSARRWMLASYLDFEAGAEEPDTILEALRTYVTTYADYLLTVNEYNLQVIKLQAAIGETRS